MKREIQTNPSGRTIVVTGGTRGIGLGTVRVLARAGAEVMIAGRKDPRRAQGAKDLSKDGFPIAFGVPYAVRRA